MRIRLTRWGKVALSLRVCVFAGLAAAGLAGCCSLPVARSRDRAVQCRRDMRHAEQLRGLDLKREIAIERESPDKLFQALGAELDKPENRAFLADTGVLLQQLRVIRREDDLKSLFLKVMAQQVAAYYDPEKKRVAYIEGAANAMSNSAALPMMERFVYVHEFCHAVEDSHFDIERLSRESMRDFDRNMAMTSLIEGDAMLVGLDSLFEEAPANTATPFGALAVQVMGRVDLSDEVKAMGDCPAFLSGALLRPYLDGGIFSNRLRREAGWPAVNAVFEHHQPSTTAEILYPERRFLHGFAPAAFTPDRQLFGDAKDGVLTNRVGAMGMALWLGGKSLAQPDDYRRFLKGWLGDQIYFVKDAERGVGESVWLSYWERAGQAKAFCRRAEKRLSESFKGTAWSVRRSGRLVAVVWSDKAGVDTCAQRANFALQTRVDSQASGGFFSWCNDLPWPIRFPQYDGYSRGFELLGGHGVDVVAGEGFSRFNVADGLIVRAETNPDRCYWGTLGGLVRYVRDERSDFTFWGLPVVATWFRRGTAESEQFVWRVLWGLVGHGTEREASVLFIPVWRAAEPKSN